MWKFNKTDNLPGNSLYHSADELYHYGVLGMKWKHHKARLAEYDKKFERGTNKILSSTKNMNSVNKKINSLERKLNKEYKDSIDYKIKRDKRIKIAKVVGGTAAVAAGAYAVHKYFQKKGIKIETDRARKTRELISENKRLDKLLSTSTKNLNNFSKDFITKDNLDKIAKSKKTVSADDAARLREAYDLFFKK